MFIDHLDLLIDLALQEDIGNGDHTTLACIGNTAQGQAQLKIKQAGVLCGVDVARRVFARFDQSLQMSVFIEDGHIVKPGDVAFTVEGLAASILQTERLALNFMQRMSGIATQTRAYVQALEGTKTRLLDTRKTTPGFRQLEKYAVRAGGGNNHRFGLYDMILIKDNHIDYAGGAKQAVALAKKYLQSHNLQLDITVEARSLDEISQILEEGGVKRILIDNFAPSDLRQAVDLISGRCETEISGGITLETIRQYAEAGVDYISAGALTHQIMSLDMSLKAVVTSK